MATQKQVEAAAQAAYIASCQEAEVPANWEKEGEPTKDIWRRLMKPALAAAEAAKWESFESVPDDPWRAFAWFVSKCGSGFGMELINQGKTDTQARNIIIGCLLDFAAGEACRIARRESREPDHQKWTKAVNDAFDRAVKRTLPPPPTSAHAAPEAQPDQS